MVIHYHDKQEEDRLIGIFLSFVFKTIHYLWFPLHQTWWHQFPRNIFSKTKTRKYQFFCSWWL